MPLFYKKRKKIVVGPNTLTEMPDRMDLRNKPSSRLAGPPRERNSFMFMEALARKAIPFILL